MQRRRCTARRAPLRSASDGLNNVSGSGPPTWRQICALFNSVSTAKPFSSSRRSQVWRSLIEVAQRVAQSSKRRHARLLATSFTGDVLSCSPAFAIHQQLQ
eukprot:12423349-Karenia_brevis.AAC.1